MRLEKESDEEYGLRLIAIKVEDKPTDLEWQDIINMLSLDIHYDSLRKSANVGPFCGYKVMQYYKEKIAALKNSHSEVEQDSYMKELELKKQELEKEKVKLRDQRNDLNRELRNQARFEERIDELEASLKAKGREEFTIPSPTVEQSGNDLLVTLSDLHIGAEHYSFTGCFNSDIAKDRLGQYLSAIFEIQEMHKSENCYVTLLGDLISGSIHRSLQVANRENVIKQITTASALITEFIKELSKNFNKVIVNSVNGNHSRITKKEDAVKDERLDSLVPWYVSAKLEHIPNITFETVQLDSTVSIFTIRDKNYVSVHGDYDGFTDAAVSKLVLWLGFRPDCIVYGHKHFPAMSECAGIKMIQSGCLSSTGDDFTIEKRLRGKANQTVLVCTERGIKACYPVELD